MFRKLREKYERRLVLLGKYELVAKICSFFVVVAMFAGACYGIYKAVAAIIKGCNWRKEKHKILESLKGYERREYREPLNGEKLQPDPAE